MRCQRCGKEISPLRQLTDRAFCSEDCKKRGPRASASVLRDLEFDDDPFWVAAHTQANKPQPKTSGMAVGVVVVGLVGAIMIARVMFPETGGAVGGASPLARVAPTTMPDSVEDRGKPGEQSGWMSGWLQKHLPGARPVEAKMDFARQTGDWVGNAAGWMQRGGAVRPGRLRLWKPTIETRDYEVEFSAAIEKKAMGWAFRAKDTNTYYATKIILQRPGLLSGASILRYGVKDREIFGRVELPLPTVLERARDYQITMLVEGDRFTTLIDGRMVDEWTDGRLKAGGVGFFADEGESSTLKWASFREKKGLLSRFMSANLFLPPGVSF